MSSKITAPSSPCIDNAAEMKASKEALYELSEKFRDQRASPEDIERFIEFSTDACWQVRREVAYALRIVPDDIYSQLVERLSADCNYFVQKIAKRAAKERREDQKKLGFTQRTVDEIEGRREAFERRHGKAAMKAADRLHDQSLRLIVGAMIHDIKSILTPLSVLCRELGINDDHQAARRINIWQSLELLSRTVLDMEQFVRPVNTERTDECLADVMQEAADLAKHTAQTRGVDTERVRLQVDVPRWIHLPIERHKIIVAVANLVTNAFESFLWCDKRRRFEIRIAATSEENMIALKIEDNGIGIADEEKISRRYFVPGRLNKSKQLSTGFGMANASRYFMAHGGSMDLFSKEDEGTTVLIQLPKTN
ncbi:MAG: HAMP domain-containing sensor histidine kinase [Pirellulaceae bacterium]|nr:HAMP domain-containing sensor histidine kinase [Pirellulaceae bacterium]